MARLRSSLVVLLLLLLPIFHAPVQLAAAKKHHHHDHGEHHDKDHDHGHEQGKDHEEGCYFQAIYSFGDSIADTGNLIREGGDMGAFGAITKFPYGMTFHVPTGRCSDGQLILDYFAQNLKLPLIPPYLDSHADFEHGVNFAVAGATALDQSFFVKNGIMPPFTNSSLDVQLNRFRDHIKKTCGIKQPSDCRDKFERSLFFVGEIGGNDYNYALLTGKSIEEVKVYVPDVVASIINVAQEVIDAGATHLVVPGNFAIGCMPSYLTTFHSNDSLAYDDNKCLKDLNDFSQYHNKHLKDALKELRKANEHVTIMYADYYHAHLYLFKKASSLGFDKDALLESCCGVGGEYNYDMTRMCGSPESTTCPSPSRRISWDGIHLTQEAYKIITKKLTLGGLTTPNNDLWKKWMCYKNH